MSSKVSDAMEVILLKRAKAADEATTDQELSNAIEDVVKIAGVYNKTVENENHWVEAQEKIKAQAEIEEIKRQTETEKIKAQTEIEKSRRQIETEKIKAQARIERYRQKQENRRSRRERRTRREEIRSQNGRAAGEAAVKLTIAGAGVLVMGAMLAAEDRGVITSKALNSALGLITRRI